MTSPAPGSITVLFPGDLRRPAIGRAVRAALLVALAFWVFTVTTKEARPINEHVPWADDPYDTFVSLALFFVPLAGLAAGARVLLCRRAEPLPAARARGVVRAAWIAVAVPTAAAETCALVRAEVDELVSPLTPANFQAVSLWYDYFEQLSDTEVRELLERADAIEP